jgi:hypothetical protein
MKKMKNNDQKETIDRLSSIMPTSPDTLNQLFQDQEDDKFSLKASKEKFSKFLFKLILFAW